MIGETQTGNLEMRRRAARLLALSHLAECAAFRCSAVRFLVYWILRPVEAILRDYVNELIGWQHFTDLPAFENEPADAIILAFRFCELAHALKDLSQHEDFQCALPPDWRTAPSDAVKPAFSGFRPVPTCAVLRQMPLNDTS